MPEFLHADSYIYLVKEHRSVVFLAEFHVIFKTKNNKTGLCFSTGKFCKNLYEIPTNETASDSMYEILTNETAPDSINNKRHCPMKFDNILGA